MKFLKGIVSRPEAHEGDTELFNMSQILNIHPRENGYEVKILMGAGLAWFVYKDSLEIVELETTDDFKNLNWEV